MAGPDSITSIQQLFEHPQVQKAQVLELCICDAVHFRLLNSRAVFELVEERLKKRNAHLFEGFAELRSEVERIQRVAPTKEKVDSCCIRKSEWVTQRQIIYSTELEAWMDVAYPNPWALDLYHEALRQGKAVYLPKQGPFTELFHKMLLQKCGFERVSDSIENKNAVRIFIGEQVSLPKDCLHLCPPAQPASGSLAFSGLPDLASQLVTGVLTRDGELQSAKAGTGGVDPYHSLGYQYIGPTLLLLLQSLQQCAVPMSFSGKGSGFLTTVCDTLRYPWPWLPPVTSPDKAAIRYSLFPDKAAETALCPARSNDHPSVIEIDQLAPVHLLLPALELFIEAAHSGSSAAVVQAGAAGFLKDFAQATRGLFLPIPFEPVIKNWKRLLLSPESDFVRAFSVPGVLPGWQHGNFFRSNLRAVKEGRWPTGTYLTARGPSRLCLRLCAPQRIQTICRELHRTQ